MAQVSITQLPQAQALTGTESVPIVQNGVTVQTTTGAISGAGALNYPFLTVGSTAGLSDARYLAVATGLALTDGGAGSTLQINMTGAAASLNSASTGMSASPMPALPGDAGDWPAACPEKAVPLFREGHASTYGSATNAEPFDQGLVARFVFAPQVIEQLPALADHFQQSPARMVILDMSLEVIGKPIDTCRQKSDLNFRGPGVARSTPMFRNDSSLLLNGNRHFVIISVNSKGKSLS